MWPTLRLFCHSIESIMSFCISTEQKKIPTLPSYFLRSSLSILFTFSSSYFSLISYALVIFSNHHLSSLISIFLYFYSIIFFLFFFLLHASTFFLSLLSSTSFFMAWWYFSYERMNESFHECKRHFFASFFNYIIWILVKR